MTRLRSAWDGVFAWEGSVRALAILRLAVGPLIVLHLLPFLRDWVAGTYYADHFYAPWVSWFPEAPRWLYGPLLWACVVAAAMLSAGLLTRLASSYAFAFVAYNMFLSQTHFRHNRNFLLIVLLGLVILPCGRVLSLDAWRRRRAARPQSERARLWPLWLLRVEVSAVYFGSGFSKLRDPDWFGGVVTWDRVRRFRHVAAERGAPAWLLDVVGSHGFHVVFAKVAVFTELFIAFGLWFPRTRLAAIWIMFWFHASIEVSASVQIFSFLAIAATLIWVTPRTRDRVLELRVDLPQGRRASWLARWLDWLARFERRVVSDPSAPAVAIIDRDGTRHEHGAAWRLLLSRLPLTFVPFAPMSLPIVRRLWDRTLAPRG